MDDVVYVDTRDGLLDLCGILHGSSWLALDTEFIRDRTYYPQLCLLQIANADCIACVDTLALTDIGPLLDLLYDPAVLKVLHSAVQDYEIFCQLRAVPPCPVFDTQIAAALLGDGEQIGYARLVKMLLDVELDKSQTRTDWSRRPLQPAQMRYAADDVRYLRAVYRQQRESLIANGRLAWLEEECRSLCNARRYRVEPEQAWLRVKGKRHLQGLQLAILQQLATWRERRAVAENRPRRWIVGDEVLLNLALHMPSDRMQLNRIRGARAQALKRYGAELLKVVQQAQQIPQEQWPQAQSEASLSGSQIVLFQALSRIIRECGQKYAIAEGILATRRELERLASGDRDVCLLQGWRAELVGTEIRNLLNIE